MSTTSNDVFDVERGRPARFQIIQTSLNIKAKGMKFLLTASEQVQPFLDRLVFRAKPPTGDSINNKLLKLRRDHGGHFASPNAEFSQRPQQNKGAL
jgi:hypothetical protein